MEKINIGIIGLGTVGSGVVKTLKQFENINIKKIAVKNLTKKRNIESLDESILTDNPLEIVADKDIQIVVELVGGIEPAFELLKIALYNGKQIITANKELLAKYGKELFDVAIENNATVLYDGAIGGGIPIILPVKMALSANKITQIAAILNGTTNYILTKMDEENADYGEVLDEAQKLGYAEADPSGDVEGFDTSYKVATLATIAFGRRIDIKKVYREGITKISAEDIEQANQLGYKIKLIALAQLDSANRADVRVHPMLISKTNSLANINNVTNAVQIKGFPVGEIMFTGPGAGEFPTASAVTGDILVLASALENSGVPMPMMACKHSVCAEQTDISQTTNKYYISINASDSPGVIGFVGTICGQNNINLTNILQRGVNDDGTAQIVVITAKCKESDIQKALCDMEKHKSIIKIKNLIRVMD